MARDTFGLPRIKPITVDDILGTGKSSKKKKRVKLTPKERLYVWEHPKMYGRTCNICGERITKLSDLELDHTYPYSKGGTKMNLAHRDCNLMKGSKSLKHVQKKMTLKTAKKKKTTKQKTTRKKKKTTRKKKSDDIFDIRLPEPPKINW